MKIKGSVKRIDDAVQVTDKFKKREFRIETEGQYPQTIQIQVTQDRCLMLDTIKLQDLVEVSINIRGREWADPNSGEIKCFNTIEAWKVEVLESSGEAVSNTPATGYQGEENDGLPF